MQQVPQFIDTEDKIVGPLTWQHLYWLLGGGALLSILWGILPRVVFWIPGTIIALTVLAFAFYRPQGISLLKFAGHGFVYFFRPRLYVWQREKIENKKHKEVEQEVPIPIKKGIDPAMLRELSDTLDDHGARDRS